MKYLIGFSLCVLMAAGCKKQISPTSSKQTDPIQISYRDYAPNPDEVVMEVEFIKGKPGDKLWENEVKVVRQLKSGFGYKDRLSPGTKIILLSRDEIVLDKFYCSADYQLSINDQNTKTFVLNKYLTK